MNENNTAPVEVLAAEGESRPKLTLITKIPERVTDGRDELNFAEFPLSAISDRVDPSVKTLVFEDKIFDKSKNEHINRKLTITSSDAFGLPTPTDEEVLLALIQLSKLQGFTTKRVYFTRYQLLQLLKWPPTGASYKRLDQALNRWMGVTMYYKNAWRDRSAARWVDESFHMLERVRIERKGGGGAAAQENLEFACSYFEWNEVVFKSFQNGNVKGLNYDFYLSIESSVAKRLFRFLDKRFYHTSELEFELHTLCCHHIGLSGKSPTGDLKRKLNAAIDELEAKGFLRPTPKEERFIKDAPKVWRVLFRKAHAAKLEIEQGGAGEPRSLEQRLTAFGVRAEAARSLVAKYPESLIEEKLRIARWMTDKKDSRAVGNPPGYLIASIRNEYGVPAEFEKSEKGRAQAAEKLEKAKSREAKALDAAARAKEKEQIQRRAIDAFWAGIDPETRVSLEAAALASADPSRRKMIEMGGKIAEAARQGILDAYALEVLANG